MTALPTSTPHTPGPAAAGTLVTAATATLVTLAAIATARYLERRNPGRRAAAALAGHTSDELLAEADLLRAAAAHRDAVNHSKRPLRAVRDTPRRRTG